MAGPINGVVGGLASSHQQSALSRLGADADDIDFSDIPELTDEQLSQFFAERGMKDRASAPKSVTVFHANGTTTQHRLAPDSNMVVLDSDVMELFSNSEAVNRALRGLIELIPQRS